MVAVVASTGVSVRLDRDSDPVMPEWTSLVMKEDDDDDEIQRE